MTQAAEREIRGGLWAKYWSQSFKTNSLCGKDWQITKHTFTQKEGKNSEGHGYEDFQSSRSWEFGESS